MSYFGGPAEREPITLSAEEFDVVWERLGEPMPVIIKVPSPGKTRDERIAFENRVWQGLDSRGLGNPRALAPELDGLLRMFIRPEREVDARFWIGKSVRVLAVGNGDYGAMVTKTGDQLAFKPCAGSGLASAVLSSLPAHPAGTGLSVTMPSIDLEKAIANSDGSPKSMEASFRGIGLRDDDAKAMVKMFTGLVHTGNFGAAARDRYGKRWRPDRVVAFFDTEEGRYLQQRRASNGTDAWSTFSPTDSRRLMHQVDELLAEAVRSAGI
ncbi:ESX secretion-associated protein EspG [Lentzea sp. NBRC 105346]|uniref:ESX secretion-associated protein EspG n=1 Tax=Lentzea sp. NBRC 105346 TaxID=3032205 RepID=UPI0024A4BBC8|nr:ESX secretion-associated protein EspG [Lentzea sp. NBRC 105346]GLZ31500.1 ESX secretion-associated protein EspG [Lentzea sp. NBRC 105346]